MIHLSCVLIPQHLESSLNLHVIKENFSRMIKPPRIQNHLCVYVQRTLGILAGSGTVASAFSARNDDDDPQPVGLREWFWPSPHLLPQAQVVLPACFVLRNPFPALAVYFPVIPWALARSTGRHPTFYLLISVENFCSPALPLWPMPRACACVCSGGTASLDGLSFPSGAAFLA